VEILVRLQGAELQAVAQVDLLVAAVQAVAPVDSQAAAVPVALYIVRVARSAVAIVMNWNQRHR
jgi:hypothetical protein